MMKVLKFAGVLAAMSLCCVYVPYGSYICLGINCVAIWKLVND